MVGVVLHFSCIVDVIFVHHVLSAGVQLPSVPVKKYEGGTKINTNTFSVQYDSNESDEWILWISKNNLHSMQIVQDSSTEKYMSFFGNTHWLLTIFGIFDGRSL